MRRTILFCLVMLLCLTTNAAVKKTSLKVLYVGGHSDMETFGEDVDSVKNAQSVALRTAAWEQYLKDYFTTVKTVTAEEYNYKLSYDYDVTIMDGVPAMPLKPRQNVKDGNKFVKIIYAQYFPEDFDRPVITIAEAGETVGRYLGLKTDWYCLCLDRYAHSMRTDHPIFKGPYKVNITLEDKLTPEGALSFAKMLGEQLPATTPMWAVNTTGYMESRGYKVGMVSRPWGFEDSPEAEWISSGLCAKSIDAVALGRQANFFHWGFAGSPADFTEEAKPLFANTVVYMKQFAGQHIIARKMFESISTRIEARENAYRVTAECYEDYKETIGQFNEQTQRMVDSLKAVKAAGGTIGQQEAFYLQWQPQAIPSREDFLRQNAGSLYDRYGTDEAAYARYYKENAAYFYGSFNDYGLMLDEDAKSLGLANNDLHLLDKAIEIWQKGDEKGKRILHRYTLLRYDNPQQFAQWIEKYRRQLFFTESGGWLWLVNSQDKNVEGNDYSVLKYNEVPEQKTPEISGSTDKQNPVMVSAVVNDCVTGDGKEVVIRIKMHPGFHIYGFVAEQDPYIATTFDFQLPEGWEKDGDLLIPSFTTTGDYGTTIYSGDVIFRQRIKGSGKGNLKLTVGYQTCDDHACLPPRDVDFTFGL